jgi:ATP-dependent DNA ligase
MILVTYSAIRPSLRVNDGVNAAGLKQQLVAQIEFTEWTPDGHLRHASFAGLRDDKEPLRVMRE